MESPIGRRSFVRSRTTCAHDDNDDDLDVPLYSRPRGSVVQDPMNIQTMLTNARFPFENMDVISENADIERSTL